MQRTTLLSPDPFAHTAPPRWEETVECGGGTIRLDWRTLTGGRSQGVQVLTVDTGKMRVVVLPTRGMGLWKAWCGELHVGWDSPVAGPVHPAFVPLHDPSGTGWLEGFDELLVRCGLESNGAPEHDDSGRLRWPLHGRIANLPATYLSVESDPSWHHVDIVGTVPETRFLLGDLELQTHYRFACNTTSIDVVDIVTNRSARPATCQLLYHVNFGRPILGEGSRLIASAGNVRPRDDRAAEGLNGWDICSGPTPGYAEQVYFADPVPDASGRAVAALIGPAGERGVAVEFATEGLPHLTFWKNTAAAQDGYAVGIEPATGLPNPRSVEEREGRLVELGPGQSKRFELRIDILTTPAAVQATLSRVQSLQRGTGR